MPKDKIQESLDRLEDKLKLDQAVPRLRDAQIRCQLHPEPLGSK